MRERMHVYLLVCMCALCAYYFCAHLCCACICIYTCTSVWHVCMCGCASVCTCVYLCCECTRCHGRSEELLPLLLFCPVVVDFSFFHADVHPPISLRLRRYNMDAAECQLLCAATGGCSAAIIVTEPLPPPPPPPPAPPSSDCTWLNNTDFHPETDSGTSGAGSKEQYAPSRHPHACTCHTISPNCLISACILTKQTPTRMHTPTHAVNAMSPNCLISACILSAHASLRRSQEMIEDKLLLKHLCNSIQTSVNEFAHTYENTMALLHVAFGHTLHPIPRRRIEP